jgi:hypothetical protein
MFLRGGMVLAALAFATPIAAQEGWPEAPMVVGTGFNRCSEILAFPDGELRRALVGQWALGFYSGLASAGAEADSPAYRGLDAGLNRLLATSPDIRFTVHDWIVARCEADPSAYVVNVATDAIIEYIDGGKQ